MKTICIDIDGTICSYTEWIGATHFGDIIPSAVEMIRKLHDDNWYIIIYSTRSDNILIEKFLKSNHIYFDSINHNPYQPKNAIGAKPLADVYLDDRAITFNGDWHQAYMEITKFTPWQLKITTMNTPDSEYQKEFLLADYEQAMEMLRHYDKFHWDITKFCFSQILVVIGACWYIHEKVNANFKVFNFFGIELSIIVLLLIVSGLFTLLCIFALLRNRGYFCKMSNYINEHRNHCLKMSPLGFTNQSKMWTDYKYPKLFDLTSTQFISVYLLSVCLVAFTCTSAYMLINNCKILACVVTGLITLFIIIGLGWLICARNYK